MKWHSFFSYQVNCAWTLNRTRSQWVNLGIHTEACMTRPETCGAAGGAISVWLRLAECPPGAGIITTIDNSDKTGFRLWCKHTEEIG